jgi:hypothetical protein
MTGKELRSVGVGVRINSIKIAIESFENMQWMNYITDGDKRQFRVPDGP